MKQQMRFLKSVMFLLALLWFVSVAWSGSLEHNFEKGNDYYSNGDYAKAISEYEKIIQAGYQSPELYYNLGNAYFRKGMLGQAIQNYIRARRLNPHDDDIRANLKFAKNAAIDKIEVTEETILLDYINRFFDSFSLSEITWLTGILYLLMMGGLIAGVVYRWISIPTPVLSVIITLFVFLSILTGVKLDRDVLTKTGVVTAEQIDVKNGPAGDYNTQFTAHAGLTFKIEREESGFYLVNFENRLKGWISKTAVAEI